MAYVRLTLDVEPALRARIKVEAFTCGLTVAQMLLTCVSLAALRDLHTGAMFYRMRWESNDYGTTR